MTQRNARDMFKQHDCYLACTISQVRCHKLWIRSLHIILTLTSYFPFICNCLSLSRCRDLKGLLAYKRPILQLVKTILLSMEKKNEKLSSFVHPLNSLLAYLFSWRRRVVLKWILINSLGMYMYPKGRIRALY